MQWQPIETAPKDGTPVDLWLVSESSGKRYRGGLGRPVKRYPPGKRLTDYKWDRWHECWRKAEDLHYVNRVPEGDITHWMPPPPPPERKP